MRRIRHSRALLAVVAAATLSLALGLPVAADLNLNIGGSANVSYTNGDGVNVRTDPGYEAGITSTLREGKQVTVEDGPVTLDDGSSWFHISADTNDGGVDGWVIADYLSSDAPAADADSASAADSSGSGPAPQAASATTASVVNTDGNGLRLRDGASGDAAVLTVMPEGATVTVLASEIADDAGTLWSQVDFEGTTGYSASAYLAVGGAAPEGATTDAGDDSASADAPAATDLSVGARAAVTGTGGGGLNLRYSAGYDAGVMTVIPEGDVVTVTDGPAGDGWYQVDYAGTSGWVSGAYLAVTDAAPADAPATAATEPPASDPPADANQPQPPAEQAPSEQPPAAEPVAAPSSGVGAAIVAEALNYVGVPYVWGGTTPSGFDCSGFTYYVFNHAGPGLSRDMAVQVNSGSYVSADALEPGDLVFFQNTYKWGLSHVGIYIGGGQFVHAGSERTGVTISDLSDAYWSPRYYTARRVA